MKMHTRLFKATEMGWQRSPHPVSTGRRSVWEKPDGHLVVSDRGEPVLVVNELHPIDRDSPHKAPRQSSYRGVELLRKIAAEAKRRDGDDREYA